VSTEHSPQQSKADPACLFEEILPDIPYVVRRACHSLGYHPCQMVFEDLVQRIILLLIDKDYYKMRSFKHFSSPQIWLFTVARHYLVRQLHRQNREVGLEAISTDFLLLQPEQENLLIAGERAKQLSVAVGRLTTREERLFRLLCRDDLSASEIAEELGIRTESVYSKRFALVRKIGEMIRSEERRR
jgi:RNA polymerase sigma factor (sigma-70 family)